jgi:hypothetical protein
LDAQVKIQIAQMTAQAQQQSQEVATNAEFQKLDRQQTAQPVDTSVIEAIQRLEQKVDGVEKHNTAPRKKIRDATGKLVGLEINGTFVPIED